MKERQWLLYGAYGYTGELIAQEAMQRGHRPTLCGRSEQKLRPLAEKLGLPYVAADLSDAAGLRRALQGHRLVAHAAGPFEHTQAPMLRACLDLGLHYLDITGELPVFQTSLEHDAEARRKNVAVISGVGFDVVPTNCLALYVAQKLPDATELDLAIAALGSASRGTSKSALLIISRGGFVRKDGALVEVPLGSGLRRFRFPNREYAAVPIPWGDLISSYDATGIPNITTYMTYPDRVAMRLRHVGPLAHRALKLGVVRKLAHKRIDRMPEGPDPSRRERDRSFVYAEARNASGQVARAWLQTLEGYTLTAKSTVLAVERTFEKNLVGAMSPARAFGADFVMELPDTTRKDSLDYRGLRHSDENSRGTAGGAAPGSLHSPTSCSNRPASVPALRYSETS